MISTEKVNEMEDRRENLKEIIDNTQVLITETTMAEERLFYYCLVTDNFLSNFNSICYQVNSSVENEVIPHNNLVNKELRLRSMPTIGTLESKRNALLIRMKHECQLRSFKKSLNHENPNVRVFYSLLTAMPCILHR